MPRQLIWTGSHNLVGDSLNKNDEAMLALDDATIWTAYHDHLDALFNRCPAKDLDDGND